MRSAMAALFLMACGGAAAPQAANPPGYIEPAGGVVFTVNGIQVTQATIDAFTVGMPDGQVEELKATGRYHSFLEQLATGVVLYQQALERNLQDDEGVHDQIAAQTQQVLASSVIQKIADEAVTDEAVQAWYDERKVQYARPSVKARHILTEEEATAAEAIAELAGGGDFADLAARLSKDPASAAKGGDLGWFQAEGMVPEVSEAAFGSTGDEVLGPIKTRFGWHVLQVTERRDLTPVEEVRGQIETELKSGAVESYINELQTGQTLVWAEGNEPPEDVGHSPGGDHAGHGHD